MQARENMVETEAEFAGAAVEWVTARLEMSAGEIDACRHMLHQIPEVADLDYNGIRREAISELQEVTRKCAEVRRKIAKLRRGR